MKTEVMTINPVIARRILDKSKFSNRSIKRNHVRFLTNQMKMGRWKLSGQPLIFDDEHGLLDGRHRLNAIIESNTSQEFLIVRGIDQEIFYVLDTGAMRSAGDVLQTNGVKDSSKIAGIIKSYLVMERVSKFSSGKIGSGGISTADAKLYATNKDVLDEYNKAPEYWCGVKVKCVAWYKSYKGLLTLTQMAPLYVIIEKKSDGVADDFFDKLCNMKFGDEKYDPTKKLTSVLMKNATSIKKYSTMTIRALIIKAWNAYYQDKLLPHLYFRDDESFPQILPK